MKFRQHVPSFVDGVEPREYEFTDFDSFNEIEWIKDWKKDQEPKFDHFELDTSHEPPIVLTVSKDEKWWWVLGYIYSITDEMRKAFKVWHDYDHDEE